MVKILDEKDFRKAGITGKISKKDFLKGLKEVKSDKEVTASKIEVAVGKIMEHLAHIEEDLKDYNGDAIELHKEVMKSMDLGAKMIAELKSELNKPQPEPASEWKFTVQRDSLGKIKSLTAKQAG